MAVNATLIERRYNSKKILSVKILEFLERLINVGVDGEQTPLTPNAKICHARKNPTGRTNVRIK